MNLVTELKKIISECISQKLKISPEFSISFASEKIPAIFSTNVAFTISKLLEIKVSPKEIAEELCTTLNLEKTDFVFSDLNGFINVNLTDSGFGKVLNSFSDETLSATKLNTGKNFSVEYISPNSNKSLHVGHLENACIGQFIVNTFKYTGANVNSEILYNNRGISIEKLVYGYLEFENKNPELMEFLESENCKSQPLIDNLYLWASEKFSNNVEVEQRVKQMVVEWEQEMEKREVNNFEIDNLESESDVIKTWKKVVDISLANQNKTIERIGCKFDKRWYESDFFSLGKKWVEKGVEKNIFRIDDGAILTDLKNYKIPDTVVKKSDGTALYITQDFALTELKVENFKADKYIWVVGNEQSLALKQLFAVCEQLEIAKLENFTHVSYPFITIKGGGKMSSRKGTAVYADSLIDSVKEKLTEEFPSNDVDFEKLALAAVKFSLLKYARTTEVKFDIDDTVSLGGFSGLYIMYAYVRCKAILEKSELPTIQIGESVLNEYEKNIISKMLEFESVVISSIEEFAAHKICHYLYELANEFNAFYGNCQVIGTEGDVLKQRLLISIACLKILKTGFDLLGIQTVDKM